MENEKKIFWTRFTLWVLFALIVPVAFLVWRFDLFRQVSKVSIGGWGLLAIIIVVVFFKTLLKYIKKGMPYSLTRQVLDGLVKVIIPLSALYAVLFAMQNSINYFLQALSVLIVSEAIAIPINPMPKWVNDNKKEDVESVLDLIIASREEKK